MSGRGVVSSLPPAGTGWFAMPRPKVFTVGLSDRDRELLELDENAGPVDDRAVIAARVGVSEETVRQVAKRFVATGGDVQATITRKQRAAPPVPSVITGEVEARVIALACTAPPPGYAR